MSNSLTKCVLLKSQVTKHSDASDVSFCPSYFVWQLMEYQSVLDPEQPTLGSWSARVKLPTVNIRKFNFLVSQSDHIYGRGALVPIAGVSTVLQLKQCQDWM